MDQGYKERNRLIDEKIETLKVIYKEALQKKNKEEQQSLLKQQHQYQAKVAHLKTLLCSHEIANGRLQVPLPKRETVTETAVVSKAVVAGGDNKDVAEVKKTVAESAGKKEKKQKDKKNKGKNNKAAAAKGAEQPVEPAVDISRLDLRVGKIVSIKLHPNAESLYLEQIDVGEEKCRNVVTGVVKFIPIEQMNGRKVICLCNLKPSKIRGELSQAMVMCASTPEKVEVIDPPADAQPGDRVYIPGFEGEPDTLLNPKKKIFEKIAPDLATDSSYRACYKNSPFTVAGKGECKSQSLMNVKVK